MLQAYTIDEAKFKPTSGQDKAALNKARWIDLSDPTPEEQSAVEEALGIKLQSPDPLDRFYITDQLRSTGEVEHLNALLLTGLDRHDPTLVPVTFVRTKGPLVSVSKNGSQGLAWLAAEGDENITPKIKDVFPVVLDMVVDHAVDVLDHVSSDLERINRLLFQHRASRQHRERLHASPRRRNRQLETVLTELGYLREVLVKLRRSVLSFRRVMGLLQERHPDEEIATKIEEFERELNSLAEAEVDLSSAVGFMLDGAVGYIGILQTNTVNVLTIVGTLLTPPMVVASIYGMNFDHMPELHWPWGYPWALGVMVVSAVGMYLFVRLRGWV